MIPGRSIATACAALAVLALGVAAPQALAAEGPDDRVIVTGGADVPTGEEVGDLIVVEGDVTVAGRVHGDLVAVEGDVTLSGTVDGDATTVAGKATLADGASVDGDLIYGDEEPSIAPGATVGGEVSDEDWSDLADAPWAAIGTLALWLAVGISLLVFGVAVVAIAPRAVEAANEEARGNMGLAVGVGAALLIGLPLLGFVALITLVGIPLGVGTFLALLPLAALGYVATSFILGRAVVSEGVHPILAFLAGFGILRAVALIPFLGGLVWIAAVVVGLGALLLAGLKRGGATATA